MSKPGEFSEGIESEFESDFENSIFGDDLEDDGSQVPDDLNDIYGASDDEDQPSRKPRDHGESDPDEGEEDSDDDSNADEDNQDDPEDDQDSDEDKEDDDPDEPDSDEEEDKEAETEEKEEKSEDEDELEGLTLDPVVIEQANNDFYESLDYVNNEIERSYKPRVDEIISSITNVRSEIAELEKIYNTPDEYGELPTPTLQDQNRYISLKRMEEDIIRSGEALKRKYEIEKAETQLHLRVLCNIKVHPKLAPYEKEMLELYREGFQPRSVIELHKVAKLRHEQYNPKSVESKPKTSKAAPATKEKSTAEPKKSQPTKVDRESEILEKVIHGKRRMAPTKGMTSTSSKSKSDSRRDLVNKVGEVGADILNSINWD